MRLSVRLRWLRKHYGYRLWEVAEKTNIAVSYLSDIERGESIPSLEVLERIGAFYGLDLSETLAGVVINTYYVPDYSI